MSEPEHDLFPVLDPPSGGLEALRARVNDLDDLDDLEAGHRRRRRAIASLPVVAAAAAMCVWVVLRPGPPGPEPWEPWEPDSAAALLDGVEHPALVAWGRAEAPGRSTVRVGEGIARRVPTRSDSVVRYRFELPSR